MRPTTHVLRAVVGAILTVGAAACSGGDDYSGTGPGPNPQTSAEDQALAATGVSLKKEGNARIVRGTGDISTAVAQFRGLVGEPDNRSTVGEQAAGRREVNWDGVPAPFTNTDDFAGDFFNARVPRGVISTTSGTGFRVSDNGFADVNPSYAGAFNAFSGLRTFSAIGSTVQEARFVVAGSTTPALVTGFGAVFAGVDRSRSATLEFYDVGGRRLQTVAAPRRIDDTGHSFAGAVFDQPIIAYVRIVTGDAPISATAPNTSTGKTDLVVLDDFIYGEPHAR